MIITEFSKFLINLKFEDIPKKSIEKAKLCFLDYLGVYKRGLLEDTSKIAIKTLLNVDNSNSTGFSSSDFNFKSIDYSNFNILNNGFIKGIASHSLDLDDGHRLAFLHPGVVVFSTALAILEDKNISQIYDFSSKDFIESVVVGYEIAIVLGKLVNPTHRNQGFHSTGTIGSFVAGAVASKLLKLNLNQTINCLGLCGTQSSGLLESDHSGSMGKTLHVGKAVYNGLLSALLAKNGFTGAESIIEGDEGFLKSMVSDFDLNNNGFNSYRFNDDEFISFNNFLDENLGKFHINEVYLKKYSFCRHIHSSIDATLYLRDELIKFIDNINDINNISNIDIDDIDNISDIDFFDLIQNINKIDVGTYKIACGHDDYSPKTKAALKQSLPYAVAIYLVCGDLSLNKIDNLIENGLFNNLIEDDLFNNDINAEEVKLIKNIVNKINIFENKELESLTPDKRPSDVTIHLNDKFNYLTDKFNLFDDKNLLNDKILFDDKNIGKVVFYPLGEVENPLLWDDILDKFYNLNSDYDLNKLEIIKDMENININDILNL